MMPRATVAGLVCQGRPIILTVEATDVVCDERAREPASLQVGDVSYLIEVL